MLHLHVTNEYLKRKCHIVRISHAQQLLTLARERGVLRSRDLDAHRVPREYLRRLVEDGRLIKTGRGLYASADAQPTEHFTLAEASRRIPRGVVCLLSALRFHDLTSESPFEIWMAIDRKAWQPKVDHPPLRCVRFSGTALDYGIEEHVIGQVPCRIYSPAKTVADCFKYRHKIGLSVALEALAGVHRQRQATLDELWNAARACRMSNVMRPYLEAVVI